MYDLENDDPSPSFDNFEPDTIEHKWRVWAARETQLRALLGHYILDGQISEYSGSPTCQRHTSHSLPIPSDDWTFGAQDASTWVEAIMTQRPPSLHFASMFNSIFSENVHVMHLGTRLSLFTASVVSEGLKSMVAENPKPGAKVVGMPSRLDISRALGRLHSFVMQSASMSAVEKKVALLRWHTISLDAAVDSSWLCRNLCGQYNVEQRISGGPKQPGLDLQSWIRSPRARLGLLHASCTHQILRELPMTQLQTIHVSGAVFSAAVVYCAFLLGGVSTIAIPEVSNWESVMMMDVDAPVQSTGNELDGDLRHYLNGTFSSLQKNKNILYDINLFSTSLRGLVDLWGVSKHMHRVVEQLSTSCTS